MYLNVYTLPQLLDLALRVPEVGAVNFNILYTILKTLIEEMNLESFKPWCNIENPAAAKKGLVGLTNLDVTSKSATLPIRKKIMSGAISKIEAIGIKEEEEGEEVEEEGEEVEEEEAEKEEQEHEVESDKESEGTDVLMEDLETVEDSESEEKDEDGITIDREQMKKDKEERQKLLAQLAAAQEAHKSSTKKKSQSPKESMAEMWKTANMTGRVRATEEGIGKLSASLDILNDKLAKMTTLYKTMNNNLNIDIKSSINENTQGIKELRENVEVLTEQQVTKQVSLSDLKKLKELEQEQEQKKQESTRLESLAEKQAQEIKEEEEKKQKEKDEEKELERAEKMFRERVTQIIIEKMKDSEKDLKSCKEIIEESQEKISELEQRMSTSTEEGQKHLSQIENIWTEFHALKEKMEYVFQEDIDFKSINDQLRQLKIVLSHINTLKHLTEDLDINNNANTKKIDSLQTSVNELQFLKADKSVMETMFDMKADKKDLNFKVDRVEFVSTIEDLGESIDKLVDKLRQLEKDLYAVIQAINNELKLKLSIADYEGLQIPIYNRIKALMFGFKKLKTIVQSSLYPEAAGITKCISCGRSATLAGSKCKPCGDASKQDNMSSISPSEKPQSDKLNSPPDDADDSEGRSFASLPESKIRALEMASSEEKTETNERNASAPEIIPQSDIEGKASSAAKGIGLQHRKSKKEMDRRFEKMMATSPNTRFCGGTHTLTEPLQRGIKGHAYELPMQPKERCVLIGYDTNWYKGSFPIEKEGQLSLDEDAEFDTLKMEELLKSCYQPYPPLAAKEYIGTPRFCGGLHTLTDPLQRGLKFAPFQQTQSPVREIALKGFDGAMYKGLETVSKPEKKSFYGKKSFKSSSITKKSRKTQSKPKKIDTSKLQTGVISIPSNPEMTVEKNSQITLHVPKSNNSSLKNVDNRIPEDDDDDAEL